MLPREFPAPDIPSDRGQVVCRLSSRSGCQIDLKGADSDDGIVRRRGADAGLQRRARQRNQLADTEWFDDVDSCAEFEQPEFLFGWRKQRRETQIRRTPKGIS